MSTKKLRWLFVLFFWYLICIEDELKGIAGLVDSLDCPDWEVENKNEIKSKSNQMVGFNENQKKHKS